MNRRVDFAVLGRPMPGGSKTGFAIRKGGVLTGRVGMTESNEKRLRPWRELIVSAALDAMDGRELLSGPLLLEVDFYLARPKGHYGSGRNADQLKPSAPKFPAVKPDATKLVRALEDALTRIVWKDDAQVVTQVVHKRFGEPERAEVYVDSFPPSVPPVMGPPKRDVVAPPMRGQIDIFDGIFDDEVTP